MPIYLQPRDVAAELEGFKSVLIVSCPICPPICISMQKKRPFIEPLKHGLKTQAFEDHIASIREPLERRGVRTGVFTIIDVGTDGLLVTLSAAGAGEITVSRCPQG